MARITQGAETFFQLDKSNQNLYQNEMRVPLLSLASFSALVLGPSLAPAQDVSSVVGHLTLELERGSHLIGSPLSAKPPAVASALQKDLFDNFLPAGSAFSLWKNGNFENYQFDGADWTNSTGQMTTSISILPWEGVVLTIPAAHEFVTAGSLLYVEYGDNLEPSFPVVPLTPAAPYSSEIHFLNNLNPVGPVGFDGVIGRSPVDGDSVLQIDLAGDEQVSRFVAGSWVGPDGQIQEPILGVGEAAFFDLSGQQFSGFDLDDSVVAFNSVPEPSSLLLIAASSLFACRRKR